MTENVRACIYQLRNASRKLSGQPHSNSRPSSLLVCLHPIPANSTGTCLTGTAGCSYTDAKLYLCSYGLQGKPQSLISGLALHCLVHSVWGHLPLACLRCYFHAARVRIIKAYIASISAAGPERSGSTWLFNAVRILLKHAHVPYDPYWITTLTTEKLQQRKHYMKFVSAGY